MAGRRFTIRGKILAAFAAISLVIGLMGAYAVHGINQSGRLVVDIFDEPLQTISHARSALTNFMAMRETAAALRMAESPPQRRLLTERLDALGRDLDADLVIVERRGGAADISALIALTRRSLAEWHGRRVLLAAGAEAADWSPLDPLAEAVVTRFDVLIETVAGQGFLLRQQALATIDTNLRLQVAGIVAALVLAGLIALILARRIVRPIEAASDVACRIADGDLSVDVPTTSRDETGALLAAMHVMQSNLRDMMEKEVAQRRSAQTRLVDAIESSAEAVALIDTDGLFQIINSQAWNFFSSIAGAMTPGRRFSDFERIAIQSGAFLPTTTGSDPMAAGEGQIADGRWLRVSRSQTRDSGMVVIWSDITELKEREAALRRAKEEAERASAAKTNFLANMSHELRTPLNAVIGFSEIIASEMFGPVGQPRYKGFANDILHSGRHLLDIINDILDITKSEAGKLQLRLEPVQVAQVFEECRRIVADQCDKAGLRLDVVPPPDSLEIDADPVKLRQILLNLLSNAVKFTAPGGTVSLIGTRSEEGGAHLVVADTGIGMRGDDIAIALTPFGQVDSRLARKYEGTGLGLPLTKALVELHHGVLDIQSEAGVGTVITVRLPPVDKVREAA